MKHVLFVCLANRNRSPTAEHLFNGWQNRWEAKSAGLMAGDEATQLTKELVEWADLVVLMEPEHAAQVQKYLVSTGKDSHP